MLHARHRAPSALRLPGLYSRQDPWDAQIDNFEQFWLGPASIGFLGLITLGVLLFGKVWRRVCVLIVIREALTRVT